MQYFNPKGQLVAESRDSILYKRVERSKHLMKIFDGYGIDTNIIAQVMDEGVMEIWLKETDTGNVFKSCISDWLNHGIHKDLGHGQQTFLPIKNWSLSNNQVKI